MVQLTPDAALTRELFTRHNASPTGLWGRGAMVFLRSPADIDALRSWLRRFTRLQDPKGKWHFFRLCDNIAMLNLAQHSDVRATILEQMLTAPIPLTLLIPDVKKCALVLVAREASAPQVIMPRPTRLTDHDLWVLSSCKRVEQIDVLVEKLNRALPNEMSALKADEQHSQIAQLVSEFERFGFAQMRSLLLLCGWALRYGPDFKAIDWDGQIANLMYTGTTEAKRITAITDLMRARELSSTPSERVRA